jgi:hypothetical protein
MQALIHPAQQNHQEAWLWLKQPAQISHVMSRVMIWQKDAVESPHDRMLLHLRHTLPGTMADCVRAACGNISTPSNILAIFHALILHEQRRRFPYRLEILHPCLCHWHMTEYHATLVQFNTQSLEFCLAVLASALMPYIGVQCNMASPRQHNSGCCLWLAHHSAQRRQGRRRGYYHRRSASIRACCSSRSRNRFRAAPRTSSADR